VSTTATSSPAQNHSVITNHRRRHGGVAISAVALVTGLAVWFFAHMIPYDGENTGTMVGIFLASVGLVFFFPALKNYLLARRWLLC